MYRFEQSETVCLSLPWWMLKQCGVSLGVFTLDGGCIHRGLRVAGKKVIVCHLLNLKRTVATPHHQLYWHHNLFLITDHHQPWHCLWEKVTLVASRAGVVDEVGCSWRRRRRRRKGKWIWGKNWELSPINVNIFHGRLLVDLFLFVLSTLPSFMEHVQMFGIDQG